MRDGQVVFDMQEIAEGLGGVVTLEVCVALALRECALITSALPDRDWPVKFPLEHLTTPKEIVNASARAVDRCDRTCLWWSWIDPMDHPHLDMDRRLMTAVMKLWQ